MRSMNPCRHLRSAVIVFTSDVTDTHTHTRTYPWMAPIGDTHTQGTGDMYFQPMKWGHELKTTWRVYLAVRACYSRVSSDTHKPGIVPGSGFISFLTSEMGINKRGHPRFAVLHGCKNHRMSPFAPWPQTHTYTRQRDCIDYSAFGK